MLEQYIPNDYLRAFVILAAVFLLTRLLVYVIEKFIVAFTKKTKTDLDDRIINSGSKPLTAIAFLIGLRIALIELPFSERMLTISSDIIYSFIIVAASFLIYGIINALFIVSWKKFTAHTESDIDDSLSSLVHGLLKAMFVVLTLIYILDVWGIEIGPFLAGLGIGGLAIAFALQSSLGNIFGGVSMILDKSVKMGDIVILDDGSAGTVQHVGIRSTKLVTFDNDVVVVPNGKLAESRIQNINQPDPKQRVVVPFSVAYGSDIDKVKKIVMAEIKKVNHFIKEPEPSVKFLEMADSGLNFKAYFYVDSFKYKYTALDEANTKIYNALNKNKIEIPFPQMDVRMRK